MTTLIQAIRNGLSTLFPVTGEPGAIAVREASGKITGITGGTASGEVMTQDQFGTNSDDLLPAGTPQLARLGLGVAADAVAKLAVEDTTAAVFPFLMSGVANGTAITNVMGPIVSNKSASVNTWAGILFSRIGGAATALMGAQCTNTGSNYGRYGFGTRAADGFLFRFGIDELGIVIGPAFVAHGGTHVLALAGGATSPTAPNATADVAALYSADKAAGDRRFRVRPEAGGWLGLGNNCIEAENAIGLQPNNLANGQRLNVDSLTELLTIAAAAFTDTTIQWPANCIRLGVSVRVTVAIPTATTFDLGSAAVPTLYASAVAVAANTTHPGTNNMPQNNVTASAVRITPSATPATNAGRVRVTLHFLTITPPTS